jgi:hypothetical protein
MNFVTSWSVGKGSCYLMMLGIQQEFNTLSYCFILPLPLTFAIEIKKY